MDFKLDKFTTILTSAWISTKLGLLKPALCLLIFLMIIDYISGLLAAKKEAFEHPNDKNYGWNSKKGTLGIYKKVGYIFTILVSVCLDYLIYKFADAIGIDYGSQTLFGLLVTIWFIVNEILSILENAGRMGVTLPEFLHKVLSDLKQDIDIDKH